MDNDQLKPCPFCGGMDFEISSLLVYGGRKLWRVGCANCDVWYTFFFDTKEKAIKAWNTRYNKRED